MMFSTVGQMWGPVMIFTCQIPDFAPGGGGGGGGGGGVSRNNDIGAIPIPFEKGCYKVRVFS